MKKLRLKKYIICYVLITLLTMMGLSGCGQTADGSVPQGSKSSSATGLSAEETMMRRNHSTAYSLEDLFTTIDLMDATIYEMQEAMETGNLTSERLTQMYIDRIETYDKALDLNSILAINPEAMEDARELDREREEGNVRGPLHGIPVVVKANMDVKGMATTAGARILQDMIAPEDSFVVKKLREAGAVILGQANMSEFAFATASSRSTLGGNVHNAYDTIKTPAGSSGGTAVAVTCDFAAAGVGTDTGGSIRNPSSFANIYGMRPSKGLVSDSGILPLKAYKDTAGPMARTAEDMAIMLEAMAGTDENDDYTVEVDADAMAAGGYRGSLTSNALKGMKLGYLTYSFEGSAKPSRQVEAMLDRTLSVLTDAGAEIVDISDILTTGMIDTITAGIYTDTFEYDVNKYLFEKGEAATYSTVRDMAQYNPGGTMHMYLTKLTQDYASLAASFETTPNPYTRTVGEFKRIMDWQRALDGREQVTKILEDNGIDAVMYLSFFDVATYDGDYVEDDPNYAGYDIAFGPKLGLPEISLPMGFSESGSEKSLPLGLSLFTGFGREDKLIKIAYSYEQQAGDEVRRIPDNISPLKDEALIEFIADITEKAIELSNSRFDPAFGRLVSEMLEACESAKTVDQDDPYAVYEAARGAADAYDRVKAILVG